MKKKSKFHRVTLLTLMSLAWTILVPLTANAFSSSTFATYVSNSSGNKQVSGSVYTKDPSQVQVKVSTGTGSSVVTATYGSADEPARTYDWGYDDQNTLYYNVMFNWDNYGDLPTGYQVSDDGGTSWTTLQNTDYEGFYSYNNPNDAPRLDAFRIAATQNLSSVAAATYVAATTYAYVPANTELFRFTPADDITHDVVLTDDLNVIGIDFGTDGVANAGNISAGDFTLTDLNTQQNITISGESAAQDIDWEAKTSRDSTRIIYLKTATNLVKDHSYVLKTSSTAQGNEIKLPAAGNYDMALRLGSIDSWYSEYLESTVYYLSSYNAHFFDNVSISFSSTPPPYIPPYTPPVSNLPTPSPSPSPTPSPTPAPTPATEKPVFNDKIVDAAKLKESVKVALQSAPAKTFSDVPATNWSAKAVEIATKLGIITGKSDGNFHGNDNVTRAEFATMLVKALNLDTSSASGAAFGDTQDHWAKAAIDALKANGIVNGNQDGSFKPNQAISRAEIAAILARVMNLSTTAASHFSDTSGNWASQYIDQLSSAGIISGKGNGKFAPNANASRSESVTMILRMLNVNLDLGLEL